MWHFILEKLNIKNNAKEKFYALRYIFYEKRDDRPPQKYKDMIILITYLTSYLKDIKLLGCIAALNIIEDLDRYTFR